MERLTKELVCDFGEKSVNSSSFYLIQLNYNFKNYLATLRNLLVIYEKDLKEIKIKQTRCSLSKWYWSGWVSTFSCPS